MPIAYLVTHSYGNINKANQIKQTWTKCHATPIYQTNLLVCKKDITAMAISVD